VLSKVKARFRGFFDYRFSGLVEADNHILHQCGEIRQELAHLQGQIAQLEAQLAQQAQAFAMFEIVGRDIERIKRSMESK
jgi:uncharacterized small protein (DUF1192 family)